MEKAFFITVPHAGEEVPSECKWLQALDPVVQKQDMDRFVDQLYLPAIQSLEIPSVIAHINRYVVDLNRSETDIEARSVKGAENQLDRFADKGLHWVKTTQGESLLKEPHTFEFHKHLVESYYRPWHRKVEEMYSSLKKSFLEQEIFQLDCHSMPSRATAAHTDAGEIRPEVVISDYNAKSCSAFYKDLVLNAYQSEFNDVNYNYPYIGGGVTVKYGKPSQRQNCIQVELRRDLYMDEETKDLLPDKAEALKQKLARVIEKILVGLP